MRNLALVVVLVALAACRAQTPPPVTILEAPPQGGVFIEDHVDRAVVHGDPSAVSISAANPVLGEQRTLVILVNFSDMRTQDYSIAEVQQLFFTTVSDFYRASSADQLWLTGDVVGWYSLPQSSATCDYFAISDGARQAAEAAGVALANYQRYVYVFPKNACLWWGFGSIGGLPSQAWINGPLRLQVVAHEMGHNFGLWHAHSKTCGTTSITEPCQTQEYGDMYDIMGWSVGWFGAFNREQIGWAGVRPVTASGTYALDMYESANPAMATALKIAKPDGSFYYVESRQGSNGLLVRSADSGWNSSMLLDMTPTTPNFYDAALTAGQQFTDTAAQMTIGATSVSPTGATVTVTYGATPPPPPPPHPPPPPPDPPPPPPPPPPAAYDFTLTSTPTSQSVARNRDALFALSVGPVDGASIPTSIRFKASSVPNADVKIDSRTWMVKARSGKRGHTTITITGTGAGQVHSLTLGLDVR